MVQPDTSRRPGVDDRTREMVHRRCSRCPGVRSHGVAESESQMEGKGEHRRCTDEVGRTT